MARLGRIPVAINGITVGGMGVKNVQVSRKQTQKIHNRACHRRAACSDARTCSYENKPSREES